MLTEEDRTKIRILSDSGVAIDISTWTQEQIDYLRAYTRYDHYREKKEEVMNKFLVMADGVFAEVEGIELAKVKAKQFIEEVGGSIKIYELKMTAEIEKPKVDFKEV